MGGLLSTVTNEFIFRRPVPAKSSCHVPEKTWQKQSRVTWHGLVKIGGSLFVSRAKVYLKINPFVTVEGDMGICGVAVLMVSMR